MSVHTGGMTSALRAGAEVAQQVGIAVDDPVLVQETNNTVVWLRPQPIMAKVATRADSAEGLVREHQLARALAALGARVARPLPGTAPIRHRTTGFLVTLWCRLEHDGTVEVPEATLSLSLRLLHGTLALAQLELPSFRDGLERGPYRAGRRRSDPRPGRR